MRLPAILFLLAVACGESSDLEPRELTATNATASRSDALPSCDKRALVDLISAPHEPASLEQVGRICPKPTAALVEIARAGDARGLTRFRAIALLGQSGEAREELARLALARDDRASIRRNALAALGRAGSAPSAIGDATARSALSDPDAHVRAEAARLLGGSADPASPAR